MSDSTNAERPGYTRSESVLSDKLIEIFSASRGRIIVATFASNIHRIQQVLDASQRFNRKVVISGVTMQKNIEIARSLGYLDFKEDLIVEIKEAQALPNKKLVIICTGSQGEPMSALARMANNTHKHFVAGGGDTVIVTASVIPGNERMVYNVINSLMKLGAEVYYEQDEDIHVSGHGSQEELKLMISLTNPRFFMPIHGEYRQLRAHARLAESLGIKSSRIRIAENGTILELTKKSFEKTGALSLNTIFVDGLDIEDVGSGVIHDRQTMAAEGMLVITLVVSEGMLIRPPDIVARGFITSKNMQILEIIRKDVEEQAHKLLWTAQLRRKWGIFEKSMKNFVYRIARRIH